MKAHIEGVLTVQLQVRQPGAVWKTLFYISYGRNNLFHTALLKIKLRELKKVKAFDKS
jgi:hypothetical protein